MPWSKHLSGRAARSLSANCQRSSAVSLQHDFTIKRTVSCGRHRNRLPWGWHQLVHFPSWPMSASGWAGLLGAVVGGDHGWARSSSSHFDGGALAPCSIAVLSCRHRVFHSSTDRLSREFRGHHGSSGDTILISREFRGHPGVPGTPYSSPGGAKRAGVPGTPYSSPGGAKRGRVPIHPGFRARDFAGAEGSPTFWHPGYVAPFA